MYWTLWFLNVTRVVSNRMGRYASQSWSTDFFGRTHEGNWSDKALVSHIRELVSITRLPLSSPFSARVFASSLFLSSHILSPSLSSSPLIRFCTLARKARAGKSTHEILHMRCSRFVLKWLHAVRASRALCPLRPSVRVPVTVDADDEHGTATFHSQSS